MNPSLVLALAFGIGVIAGLRTLTAPVVVAWAAHWKWIDFQHSFLSFLGSTPAVIVLSLLALGELVMDKLPTTPSRKAPMPFVARILSGALCGGALCAGADRSMILGAVMGAIGAVVGTLGGYEARTRSAKASRAPFVMALVEDVVAIGGGFLLVSRLL